MSNQIKSPNFVNSVLFFQSFKIFFLHFCLSIVAFLLIFNFASPVFANFEPEGPKPPNFPTPNGLENDNLSIQSSKSSSNFSQNSLSQSSSFFSNSSISSLISTSSSNLFSISPQSNQVLVNLSNSSSTNSSTSSKITIPEIAQDGTVRTGGFSSFLFVFIIIGGIFGYQYYQTKNRPLKTVEKKLK